MERMTRQMEEAEGGGRGNRRRLRHLGAMINHVRLWGAASALRHSPEQGRDGERVSGQGWRGSSGQAPEHLRRAMLLSAPSRTAH